MWEGGDACAMRVYGVCVYLCSTGVCVGGAVCSIHVVGVEGTGPVRVLCVCGVRGTCDVCACVYTVCVVCLPCPGGYVSDVWRCLL